MRITSIHVRNFRGCREFHLEDVPPALFITGLNGSGKTSLLNAIQMVLCEPVFDHAGKQILVSDLIGPDGRSADVRVGVDINGERIDLSMHVTAKGCRMVGEQNGRPVLQGSPKDVRAALWRRCGVDPRQAACAVNPRAYLIGKNLGTLFAELGIEQLDLPALLEYAGDHAEWFSRFLRDQGLEVRRIEDFPKVGKTVDEFRCKVTHARLAEIAAELARMEGLTPPVSASGDVLTVDSIPDLESGLEACERERDELVREQGRAGMTGRSRAQIDAEIDRVRRGLEKAETVLAKATEELDGAETGCRSAHSALQDALRKQSDCRGKLALAEGERNRAQREVDAFKGHECPTCKSKLTEKKLRDLIGPHVDALDAMNKKIAAFEETLAAIDADIAAMKRAVDSATTHRENRRGSHGEASSLVQELRAELKALERETPAHTGRTEMEIAEDLATVDQRIAKYRSALETLHLIQKRGELEQAKAKLEAEKVHLDWALTAFRDGKAANDLGGLGRNLFEGSCNVLLSQHGYEIATRVEGKETTVLFGRVGGQKVPVAQISQGELVLAQLAVGAAFAQGGPVIVDGLDGLDGHNKGAVFDALAQVLELAGTVILSGAWGLGNEPDLEALQAALEPAAVVWMESDAAPEVQAVA